LADCTRAEAKIVISNVMYFFCYKTGFKYPLIEAGNTKGGSITVPLTSCLTGFESAV
jgi:hypothetical protein